jgi:3-dehydroquinate dehydratase-1
MRPARILLKNGSPMVVGSFGDAATLRVASAEGTFGRCDLAEIRLDLLVAAGASAEADAWQHLRGHPLLFTARRADEGGAGMLDAAHRADLLRGALDDASLIDVEVASLTEMRELLDEADGRGIPWIASFHDFTELPSDDLLREAVRRAKDAGAAAFKVAAMLRDTAELSRLVAFQLADHGMAVATMGMGALAPASRILCAQAGSVLNYGYLGTTPTAPGQWECGLLKSIIPHLEPLTD